MEPIFCRMSPAFRRELDGDLPDRIVWMPKGTHDISAGTPSGEPWIGRVLCDEQSYDAVAKSFFEITKTRRVYIDKDHDDGAATGWVKAFSWDPYRGICAHVEWTALGEELIRGHVYHSFSPAFLIERSTGRVAGLMTGKAAGGLVNSPAFAAMPSISTERRLAASLEATPPHEREGMVKTLLATASKADRDLLLLSIVRAQDNEFMVRAAAAQQIGYENLAYMNRTGRVPGSASSGSSASATSASRREPNIILVGDEAEKRRYIINSGDNDARIRYVHNRYRKF
jgi:hypothetical protein